jgi:hypothetical protein
MDQLALRDYLCSQSSDGPWTAVFASSHQKAAMQFSMDEALTPGDVVFVGIPSPVPHVFSSDQLVRFITERLGIHSYRELEEMATGLAGEANYRVQRLASNTSAKIGRVLDVQQITVTTEMSIPQVSRAI